MLRVIPLGLALLHRHYPLTWRILWLTFYYWYCSCFVFLFVYCYRNMQFFIHCNFFCQEYKFTCFTYFYINFSSIFFQYLITGKLGDSCCSHEQELLLQFWWQKEKHQLWKRGWINLPIALKFRFFRRNNTLRYTIWARSFIGVERGYDVDYFFSISRLQK